MRKLFLALAGLSWVACQASQPGTATKTRDERQELLELVARGYYPGRSGQIFFVPEPGEVFLRKPMGYYRLMHGSPWDYDRHIPFLFYGPGFIEPGSYEEPATQQDVAPTLMKLLGLPPGATMSGRPLDDVLRAHDRPPKVIVLAVLDGARFDYFARYADALPTLTQLKVGGAWFTEARVNYVPSVTSAGHTTLATGADPRIHGIAGNGFYDRVRGGYRTLFEGLSPANVMVLGLADLWNIQTDGAAVIVTQGTTPRATVSLAGHGGCTPNGRKTVLAMFDYHEEGFVTNPDCYRLPDYLEAFRARPVWEKAGGKWRDLEIDSGRAFVTTGLFPAFQADALIQMIVHEGVGRDDITDLVLVNFKTPDYVGHFYGPESEEMRDALAALDYAFSRVVVAVEQAAGAGTYVFAVTADHGMPEEPETHGHARHFIRELDAAVDDRFDPDEGRLVREYLDTANHQLYLDAKRLDALGLQLSDVAQFLESLPEIRAAFGEDEVRAIRIDTP